MRVELGGGPKPRDGFINCDFQAQPGVHRVIDFEQLGINGVRLPFEDSTVDEVYSSHCFEHVLNLNHLLWEIGRICRVGARVEIRVPHWLSQMAMCAGHQHVFSEIVMNNLCNEFAADWWPKERCQRRLRLTATNKIRWHERYMRAERLFPGWSENDILDFVPGCCHEFQFIFGVIENV